LRVVPEARKRILSTKSPLEAWREGQHCKKAGQMLEGYDKDELMEKIFRAKLEQHPYLVTVLKASKDRLLLKVTPDDSYWGIDPDGIGQNKMGILWMKLRTELE
jgi:N-glycosidase YbiA